MKLRLLPLALVGWPSSPPAAAEAMTTPPGRRGGPGSHRCAGLHQAAGDACGNRRLRRQGRRECSRQDSRRDRWPHVVRLGQRRQRHLDLLQHVRRGMAAGDRRRGVDGRARSRHRHLLHDPSRHGTLQLVAGKFPLYGFGGDAAAGRPHRPGFRDVSPSRSTALITDAAAAPPRRLLRDAPPSPPAFIRPRRRGSATSWPTRPG